MRKRSNYYKTKTKDTRKDNVVNNSVIDTIIELESGSDDNSENNSENNSDYEEFNNNESNTKYNNNNTCCEYISSLDVAEMIDKRHSDLLRDIRSYRKDLGLSNFAQSDFWIESTYQNSQNKTQPCYNITKKRM